MTFYLPSSSLTFSDLTFDCSYLYIILGLDTVTDIVLSSFPVDLLSMVNL